jgi:hypothetical protein
LPLAAAPLTPALPAEGTAPEPAGPALPVDTGAPGLLPLEGGVLMPRPLVPVMPVLVLPIFAPAPASPLFAEESVVVGELVVPVPVSSDSASALSLLQAALASTTVAKANMLFVIIANSCRSHASDRKQEVTNAKDQVIRASQ